MASRTAEVPEAACAGDRAAHIEPAPPSASDSKLQRTVRWQSRPRSCSAATVTRKGTGAGVYRSGPLVGLPVRAWECLLEASSVNHGLKCAAHRALLSWYFPDS